MRPERALTLALVAALAVTAPAAAVEIWEAARDGDLATVTAAAGSEAACGRVLDTCEDELLLRHFDMDGTREASRFCGRSEGLRLVQTQLGCRRSSSWQPTTKPDPSDHIEAGCAIGRRCGGCCRRRGRPPMRDACR